MTKEHTYQDLDLFFEQFKNMPEYITLEQVTQFIQHPKPSSSFQLKGSTFKLWSILITAASVIAISTILYFSLSGSSNQAQEQSIFHEKSVPPAVTNPVVKTDSSESESQEITHTTHIVQTNPDADEFVSYGETESDKNNGFKALNSQNQDILDTLIEIEEKQIFYIVEDSQTFNGGEPFVESLKNQKLDLVDEPIDGNPYIIDDLSLDELRNLGLDIQH